MPNASHTLSYSLNINLKNIILLKLGFVFVIVYGPSWDDTCKKNCPQPSPQLNCAISNLWIFHIYKGCIKVLLVDLTTNRMVTNTLFTLTFKQDELGKSMLFTFVKSIITPGRTSISHFMLDNFRIYKDSSPECWSYVFFARRYNDEIKWWKQTSLDFSNNHCSCNICSYTFVGLCFDVCGSTLSAKNLEEHCTENSRQV